MNKQDFYSLLKTVPKAELHLHGEAVISNDTIRKLYKSKFGEEMPEQELESLWAYSDLPGFLASFIKIQNYFVNPDDCEYYFSDFGKYLYENNIVYVETFFAPTSLLKNGFDFHDLTQRMSKAIIRAKEKYGATVKIIVDVSRSFGLENAKHNLELVLKENNPDIIGIGLGGDEAKGPARDYAEVFQEAKKAGLHRVAHAGETVDSWSMKDCINLLDAERIGHGISAAYDEPFMQELSQTKFPLEVSPTSNVFTKHYVSRIKDHPFKKLYKAGCNVTLNTDDPTFFKVSLIDEYWNVYSKMGLKLKDIKRIILNGFNAAFMSDEEKASYCAKVNEAWDTWFETHPKESPSE